MTHSSVFFNATTVVNFIFCLCYTFAIITIIAFGLTIVLLAVSSKSHCACIISGCWLFCCVYVHLAGRVRCFKEGPPSQTKEEYARHGAESQK